MKIGDIIYFINVDLVIEEWKILEINELNDNYRTLVLYLSCCSNPKEKTEVYYDNVNYPQGLWYSDKAVAENYRDEMLSRYQKHVEKIRQEELEKTLKSVLLPEVLEKGTLLMTKVSHSLEACLYEYDGDNYVAVFDVLNNKRDCVLFKTTVFKNI